ncbi:MAG: T9SS type A sorting domain-containing protein [Saprospiraceae bacterium]
MKIICFLLIIIFFSSILQAQPWTKNLPKVKSRSELTFFDYQNAFYDYWAPFHLEKGYYIENGFKKKARGWKQFKRWEYAMQGQINPLTGEFPKKTAQQVVDAFNLSHPQPRSSFPASWTSLGPDNSNGGYSGVGRINCVAFHPGDINTYWAGAAAGGLWVTHDNGTSWTCLTDQNGVLAVSNIIIPPDYASSHTIYIGTGDRESYDNRSIGVLKSTDNGQSWNTTGLSYSIFDNEMVNRLLIDPNNSETLLAATSEGVFKTTDGGETWNTQLTSIAFIDMEFQPGNTNTIYGSTKDGRIFVSTNGSSFGAPSFEDGDANRIELAVSPNQPTWVYAVAVNSGSGLYGVYKSINSGSTFSLVLDGNTKNLLAYESDGSGSGGQGYYDLCIAASPTNANNIVVGGVNTWGSSNGGNSWTLLNHWVGENAQEVHADKHSLTYRGNGDLFETNDGGVYMSLNNGNNWSDKTNGIVISQMYKLGVSQTDGGDIITGLQDNGTKIHSGAIWFDQIGGDGMECLIDYTDVDIQYGTLYYGSIYRTMNHWQSSDEVTAFDAGEGAWITPYIIDPVNPEILYAGYAEVWKSGDRGNNWEKISNFHVTNGLIQSMAIATSDPLVMYIAFNSNMWKTVDGGGHWTNTTNDLPSSQAAIRYISVKHNDPNTVWVALSGYTKPGVYESRDGGMTWNDISAGLPPIPVNTVVENKLLMSDNLYAGTELGVYSKRGTEDWTLFNNGLPNVIVNELEIYYASNPIGTKLRAATYGRGLWETSIPFSSTPVSTPENANICDGATASLTLLEFEGDVQWQTSSDGVSGWADVSGGSGANTENYTTGILNGTTYYRAAITNGANTIYSNTSIVNVNPTPDAAGPIAGDTTVCQGQQDIVYTVDPIADAGIYIWTLPAGITGTSSTESITLDIGIGTQGGTISVFGRNSVCDGASSSFDISVSPRPSKPLIGSISQPTCAIATGQVTLNNLPSSGEWTVTSIPDGVTLIGTGTSAIIGSLEPGNHSFTITNQSGCVSAVSSTIVIHAHTFMPPAPVVTVNGDLLHSDAPVGNQWYDENGVIAGETSPDFIAPQTGEYYTIVTLNGCMSDTSNIIYIDFTAVDPVDAGKNLNVYPNPVKDELMIEIPGNREVVQFDILNSVGQVIHKGHVLEIILVKMSKFAPGVYVVKIGYPIEKERKIVKVE